MTGSYSFDLGTRETARNFVQRPDVWWYTFPVDEEVLTGTSWHRGGAWAATDEDRQDTDLAADLENAKMKRWAADEDEDGDRW